MIILGLNILYALVLLVFYAAVQRLRSEVSVTIDSLPDVAVLIPLRNEAAHLPELINALQSQDFPAEKTKWIFIDDHSDDRSLEIIRSFNDPRIILLQLPPDKTGKKEALRLGVEASSGTWICTTDADCVPEKGWLKQLLSTAVHKNAVMVCGMVKVWPDDHFWSGFQAMETAVLQSAGAGSLAMQRPLLNTGASLCFLKSAWQEVDGYNAHAHIASGDDTFLMLHFHKHFPGRVISLVHPEAVVRTYPMSDFSSLLKQRLRWNGKVKHYEPGYIHLIGAIVMFSSAGWVYLVAGALLGGFDLELIPVILATRFIAETILTSAWTAITGQSFKLISLLGMSVFYPFFTLYSFIIRPFMKNGWKGRPL
ncbi:MAG: glycosyltransferase [Bacteroidota bacterium]|nr:glycosyltransferase [Bacteroidota bacterium]